MFRLGRQVAATSCSGVAGPSFVRRLVIDATQAGSAASSLPTYSFSTLSYPDAADALPQTRRPKPVYNSFRPKQSLKLDKSKQSDKEQRSLAKGRGVPEKSVRDVHASADRSTSTKASKAQEAVKSATVLPSNKPVQELSIPKAPPIPDLAEDEVLRRLETGGSFDTLELCGVLRSKTLDANAALDVLLRRRDITHVPTVAEPGVQLPSVPSSVLNFARRLLLHSNSVKQENLIGFLKFVAEDPKTSPFTLLVSLGLAGRVEHGAEDVKQKLEERITRERTGWSKYGAKLARTPAHRRKMLLSYQEILDQLRPQLSVDLQLSWDAMFKVALPIGHCLRLATLTSAADRDPKTPAEILALVNAARLADMDEHPLGVVLLLELLRQAKSGEPSGGLATEAYEATLALVPQLTDIWIHLEGKPFENAKESDVEQLYIAAERILSGAVGQDLGEDGLRPWQDSKFI